MENLHLSRPLHEDSALGKIKPRTYSLRSRYRSFACAWRGIIQFIMTEPNARIHGVFTILVVILSIYLHLSRTENVLLLLCITLVWIAEMINTAIEKAMDYISTERHPHIKFIKDVAAGAVLVSALCAVLAGAFIIIPKLF